MFNHMVESAAAVDEVFHALSHPTRRHMLARLRTTNLTVGQLAEPLPVSLAAASKHITVLERAGLLQRTVQGRTHVCRLTAGPLASAAAWLDAYETYWTARLDALEQVLLAGDDGAGRPADAADVPRDPHTEED
jgi:DNA-binding transcriptional ArsR family regulator